MEWMPSLAGDGSIPPSRHGHPPAVLAQEIVMASQSIAVTGRTEVPRQQLTAAIRRSGASFHTTVGERTTLLVATREARDSTTKKVKAAQLHGVRIISEDKLRNLLKAAPSSPRMEQPPAKKAKIRPVEKVESAAMDEDEEEVEGEEEEEDDAEDEDEVELKMCKRRAGGTHARNAMLPITAFGKYANGVLKKTCLTCNAKQKTYPSRIKYLQNKAEALLEASDAAYVAFCKSNGKALEPLFTSVQVKAKAAKLSLEIRAQLVDGAGEFHFNVYTCMVHRLLATDIFTNNEGWMGVASNRGAGKGPSQLMSYADGSAVTATELAQHGWRIVDLEFRTRRPTNMNAVEKKVHQILRADAGSLWRVSGAGGVKRGVQENPVFGIGLVYGRLPANNGVRALRAGPPDVSAVAV